MTDEIPHFYTPSTQWELSGCDKNILRELRSLIWKWLPAAQTPRDVIALGHMLQSFNDLISTGKAPDSGEADISARPLGDDGVGAHLAMSATEMNFSLTSFVWLGEQGHDHGAILDDNGRPTRIHFFPYGSFDRSAFDAWHNIALDTLSPMFSAPPIVHASWHSKVW